MPKSQYTRKQLEEEQDVIRIRILDDKLTIQEQREDMRNESAEERAETLKYIKLKEEMMAENRADLKEVQRMLREMDKGRPAMATSGFSIKRF